MPASSVLSSAQYGKDKIRVFVVNREGDCHHTAEYNVTVLLEGDIAASYTEEDNSVLVATDSIKNITYYLASISPNVFDLENFALEIGTHLVSKYAHIHKAQVSIEQLRWSRILVGGVDGRSEEGHPHSFFRDGDDKRVTKAVVDASAGKDKIVATVTSGISGLLLLKTTGSKFENFIRDEYTTLVEVNDRIFSTSVDLSYTFRPLSIKAPTDDRRLEFSPPQIFAKDGRGFRGQTMAARARKSTLELFATDNSSSVQATLYKMARRVVEDNDYVVSVTYTLPNKHYIPVDMKYIGIDNITPGKAKVFVPVAEPSGVIAATVVRE